MIIKKYMRCKNCKEKFEPLHFNQKFCLKEECKNKWIESAKQKQWKQRKKELIANTETLQKIISKVQKTFNLYIRLRDAGKVCISFLKPPKKANAGHYFSAGGHANVRFNEDNVHLQCEHCNTFLSGNLLNYQIGIEKRIGSEKLMRLNELAHLERRYTIEELKEINETYKQKLKELKKLYI